MALVLDNCKACKSSCEHAGKNREFICPKGISCKIVSEPPQTNGDQVREMSDEELYGLFAEIYNAGCDDSTAFEWGEIKNSFVWDEEWLKQPAEVNDG